MTTPNTQTELDKAIEQLNSVSIENTSDLSFHYGDIQELLLAAKRLKEVEKERDETKTMYERLRESVNGMTPCDLERLAYFEKHFFPMEQELTQLRADYKQALTLLKICERNGHTIWCAAGDSPCSCGFEEIKKHLSTPLAIATMKGNQ